MPTNSGDAMYPRPELIENGGGITKQIKSTFYLALSSFQCEESRFHTCTMTRTQGPLPKCLFYPTRSLSREQIRSDESNMSV